ncbi:MAG: hypothetical protein WCB51_06665 [Candidatus Dormiibacterota bacterium]
MKTGVRILALDHYFEQDLRALEAHPRLSVRRFPYQRLRRPALRMLGGDVATGLDIYNRPGLAAARRRYAAWLADEVRRLYLEQAFDVIVLPSDTFFYVRSLPQAAHALGIPVVVVQKETTVAVGTMQAHSALIRSAAPFISDFMTVCSDRHREFWLRAGAEPALIEVTGQPRFDIYAAPGSRARLSLHRVLFLSYALDAYVPRVGSEARPSTWKQLRDETEAVLLNAARDGGCEVIVKCHPQQNVRAEEERLARAAGTLWGKHFSIAKPDADTRTLIATADIVVGFQTTALYESVAARKSVIYAAWGDQYERFRERLIPFESAPGGCLRRASSAEELARFLDGTVPDPDVPCAPWYEEALGHIDGHATDRVADRLEAVAEAWPAGAARTGLERGRRRYAAGLLARSMAAEAVWTLATPAARLAGQQRRVARRRNDARQGRTMATATLRRRGDSIDATPTNEFTPFGDT